MKPYRIYEPEWLDFKDRVSGTNVRQLTSWKAHSVHPYFTENAWYDGGRRFIFDSDRGNATNIYSYDLESGEIAQLTDFSDPHRSPAYPCKHVDPTRCETYFWQDNCLYGLDLKTLKQRPIYIANKKGYNIGGGITGANGKYIYVSCNEDLSDRIYTNLGASYIGFEETFRAHPHCQILRIDLENGQADVIWEENCWIGHVNPSPIYENIITFCHEGPWTMVDNRMWTLDTDTGVCKMLRPREDPGEQIGHEYWLADGVTVAYQVHKPEDGQSITYTGFIKYDGTGNIEAYNGPQVSPDHVHSLDTNMIVTDAGKAIKLIRREGDRFDSPRVLAMHNSSFYFQNSHPHPQITPDGKHVLYATDVTGYVQIYYADIPDYDSLPYLKDIKM